MWTKGKCMVSNSRPVPALGNILYYLNGLAVLNPPLHQCTVRGPIAEADLGPPTHRDSTVLRGTKLGFSLPIPDVRLLDSSLPLRCATILQRDIISPKSIPTQ